MFRLTHVSDTHGILPHIPSSSLAIIHSGDMAPNLTRGDAKTEEPYQQEWWNRKLQQIQDIIGDRYFLYIPGNHDYWDPETLLQNAGVKAHNLTGKVLNCLGLTFYGFPWIPYIAGEWNYEIHTPGMSRRVCAIPECDILVAHCPPFGICADLEDGKGNGNSVLLNWLNYQASRLPQYLLCGHFHESRGIAKYGDLGEMTVSNAATVQHTFNIGE